jgi:hypothetical protein
MTFKSVIEEKRQLSQKVYSLSSIPEAYKTLVPSQSTQLLNPRKTLATKEQMSPMKEPGVARKSSMQLMCYSTMSASSNNLPQLFNNPGKQPGYTNTAF